LIVAISSKSTTIEFGVVAKKRLCVSLCGGVSIVVKVVNKK
jgi:hypothetical protein